MTPRKDDSSIELDLPTHGLRPLKLLWDNEVHHLEILFVCFFSVLTCCKKTNSTSSSNRWFWTSLECAQLITIYMLLWPFLDIFTIFCIGKKSRKSLEISSTRQSTHCWGRYNFGPQTNRDTNCIESEIELASPKKELSIRHLAIASVCFSTSRDSKCLFLPLFSLCLGLQKCRSFWVLPGWCGPLFYY